MNLPNLPRFAIPAGVSCFLLLPALLLPACTAATTVANAPSPTPKVTAAAVLPPSPTPAPTPTLTPTPLPSPTPGPVQGGTLVVGLVGRPNTLNPITGDDPALRELTPLLFDTLLQVDPQTARLRPGLAQSWRYSPDGRQVNFELPPNLAWSDGSPLTAAGLVDSLLATRHPALEAFSRITAPDDRTLRLTFAAINCAAVTAIAQLPLLPAAEITATLPTGSGPFMVAAGAAGSRTLTLARNPYYRRPAPLNGLTLRFLQEDDVGVALSEGQFDVVGPLPARREPFDPPGYTRLTYPAPQMVYLAMNYNPKNGDPLTPEVRQALILALDREAILAKVLSGDGQLLAGPLLPGHWASAEDLLPPPYNPDAARDLLAQAGLRDTDGDGWLDRAGKRVELGIRLSGENSLYQDLGWLLSSYYRDLGLFVRAESVPLDSVVDDLFTHDFSLAIFGWPIPPDPDQRFYWHSAEDTVGLGLNFTSYHNTGLDRLLEEGVATPGCAEQDRAEMYAAAQQILADTRPVDFILAPNHHLLFTNRLQGLNPGPFAPFTWNVADWYVQPE